MYENNCNQSSWLSLIIIELVNLLAVLKVFGAVVSYGLLLCLKLRGGVKVLLFQAYGFAQPIAAVDAPPKRAAPRLWANALGMRKRKRMSSCCGRRHRPRLQGNALGKF